MSPRPRLAFASLSLLTLAAACGSDSPASPDAADHDAAAPDALVPDALVPDAAPPADLSCIDTPAPTTAPTTIVVDGLASAASMQGLTPLAGVVTEAFATGNVTALASDTATVADGVYQLTIPTGDAPVDGYIKGDGPSGYRDSYLYPPFPMAASTDQAPLLFIDDGTFGLLAFVAEEQEADNGMIGLLVLDCAGNPVAGATVTTTPAGSLYYGSDGLPDSGATATDASGLAFIFNVAAGDVVVDATVDGMSLDEHTINARAGAITTTAVAPGPITAAP